MNIGYACINMQLSYPQKYGGKEKGVKPITTGRSMIKRTFESKGLDYANELTLANVMDLNRIIDWNILNGYKFFRMTSGLAPWKSEYEWDDLEDISTIRTYLRSAGIKCETHNVRITSHPGPFNVLTSPHEHVVENCISDLTDHGDTFDMMNLSRTPYNKINIHIGGAYGDKPKSMERFCKNFERLPQSAQNRLTVEYINVSVFLLFSIIITTSSVQVTYQKNKLWSWLVLLGPKVLHQLSTIAKVGVRNDLTNQLDPKHILIMFTTILIVMVMMLIL